jgi:hypothetical protein
MMRLHLTARQPADPGCTGDGLTRVSIPSGPLTAAST